MDNFILTLTLLLTGMLLKRLPDMPRETGTVLNLFVIYVSLPALVLLKVPDLSFSTTLLVPALMPWTMLAISSALILFIAKLRKWERETTGCLLLLIPLGNTSFLGIPMVKAFFGEQAIPYALLYDQIGSFLALATYGSVVIAFYGTGQSKPDIKSVMRRIVLFPPFISLVLAFALTPLTYPAAAVSILQVLAASLVPVVMIAVGFQLTLKLNKKLSGQIAAGLSIKLIGAPLIALLLCKISGIQGEAAQVAIFESGMPPMVSAGALAILANLSPPLTAALVGLGIILCFATLPILHQIITMMI